MMPPCQRTISALRFVLCLLTCLSVQSGNSQPAATAEVVAREFAARGVVRETRPDAGTIVIAHEAISNYMAAMTMPFKVRDAGEMAGLQRGDEIIFRLHVTQDRSWVDGMKKIGVVPEPVDDKRNPTTVPEPMGHPLLEIVFTNELGEPVRLKDFNGQALAITFFYTRCPLPDYCPRLTKNFQEASRQMATITNGPTNWHFLSVSFDSEFDSPAMLRAYGQSYGYDPAHWSFLTGDGEKIAELAGVAGVHYEVDGNVINHDFRTLIIDAKGHLQMVFPTGGDLSGQIVSEMLKAARQR
jgi:protein SCO1